MAKASTIIATCTAVIRMMEMSDNEVDNPESNFIYNDQNDFHDYHLEVDQA